MLEFYKSTKNPKTASPAERLWTEDTMYPLIITGRVQMSRVLDASIESLRLSLKTNKQRNKKRKKNPTGPKPERLPLNRRLTLTVLQLFS